MLANWTDAIAKRVAQHVEAIRKQPNSHASSKIEAVQLTNGLPVYGDLGGIIVLTLAGEFVCYSQEAATITPVEEGLWYDVALAFMAKRYPDLRDLLPVRPAQASDCPNCSGTGWVIDGRLFCRLCRSLGWIDPVAVAQPQEMVAPSVGGTVHP